MLVALGVSGGIAAYKACEVVRGLDRASAAYLGDSIRFIASPSLRHGFATLATCPMNYKDNYGHKANEQSGRGLNVESDLEQELLRVHRCGCGNRYAQ